MFERTRRGLGIAASSLKLLSAHPRLMALPVLSVITFAVSLLLVGIAMFTGEQVGITKLLLLPGFFVLLLATTFFGVFFNVALVSCVMDAFAGRPVSLRAGLSAAAARLPQIMWWSLYATTIGVLIGVLRNLLRKLGMLGALVGSAASLSWAILTYFVVPVLVTENVGPAEAVRRSTDIIKRNWGNAVGVEAGLSFLLIFGIVPPAVLIYFINSSDAVPGLHDKMLAFAGIASFAYFAALIAFISTMDVIFRTGVFIYATTGVLPQGVDPATMKGVFRS